MENIKSIQSLNLVRLNIQLTKNAIRDVNRVIPIR